MTLILTAPQRIALMAYDASTLVQSRHWHFVETLDDTIRPAVIVEIDSGDYPPDGAGAEKPTETYKLLVVGDKYGAGDSNGAEDRVRQIVASIIGYFYKRSQLQMSNLRSREAEALRALAGVQAARIRQRGIVNNMTRGAEDSGFWGCELDVIVTLYAQALEVLS